MCPQAQSLVTVTGNNIKTLIMRCLDQVTLPAHVHSIEEGFIHILVKEIVYFAQAVIAKISAKSKKVEKWRHKFVCWQSRAPTTNGKGGVGPCKAWTIASRAYFEWRFPDMFHDELLKGYPKLQGCEGYELLRGSDTNNR